MELSNKERLMLYNQYEIIKRLDPEQAEGCEINQEILENGFQYDYDRLVSWVSDETPEDVYRFVWNTFELFRALHDSYRTLSPDERNQIEERDITFAGFDGNEETKYYAYAGFVLKKLKRYEEIYNGGKVILNSHCSMVYRYEKMINQWKQMNSKRQLSLEDIQSIIG